MNFIATVCQAVVVFVAVIFLIGSIAMENKARLSDSAAESIRWSGIAVSRALVALILVLAAKSFS